MRVFFKKICVVADSSAYNDTQIKYNVLLFCLFIYAFYVVEQFFSSHLGT